MINKAGYSIFGGAVDAQDAVHAKSIQPRYIDASQPHRIQPLPPERGMQGFGAPPGPYHPGHSVPIQGYGAPPGPFHPGEQYAVGCAPCAGFGAVRGRAHRASPQPPTRQRGEDTYQPGHGVPVGGRGHLTLPITNKMLPVGGGHDIFGGAVDAEGDDASRSRPARAMNQHAASSGIFQTGGHRAGVFGMGGFGSSGPDGI